MSGAIGIDFGTTNSLISIVLSGKIKSYTENDLPHPSVVCYSSHGVICGSEAKERIENLVTAEHDGIIRSPKRLLGKGTHFVLGREIEPSAMVAELMRHLKQHAIDQDASVSSFDEAVVSIPVAMDGRRRKELRDALMQAGIHIVQFVHEPLAALYAHFRTSDGLDNYNNHVGELALVFDWGGGTLDLTLCQVGRESITQIINLGDNEVGGDFIDDAIVRYVLEKHTSENNMKGQEDIHPSARAQLLEQCEKAKIWLSDEDDTFIYVPDYYAVDNATRHIQQDLTRDELARISETYVKRGLDTIDLLLGRLGIDQRRISICLATGGMINTPTIRSALLQIFGADRLHISPRGDRIISEGCAWIAHDEARLTLAKPIEVVEARQSYLPVFKAGDPLPIEGEIFTEKLIMYCVDPRDGKAKFQLVRPQQVGKTAAADPRDIYTNLTVRVDPGSKPFFERIDLSFTVDDNLIVEVEATSALHGDTDNEQIYDLEFSLATESLHSGNKKRVSGSGQKGVHSVNPSVEAMPVGAVCARSNVTRSSGRDDLVPGELLYQVNRHRFDRRHPDPLPQISQDENLYYQPCSICRRRYNDPACNCGSQLKH